MCGRTVCSLAPDDIVKACTYRDKKGRRNQPEWKDAPGGQQYTTSYNMAPGAHSPVLVSSKQFNVQEECERVVMPMKWGLTPSWHKDDPYKVPYETNNCRVEGMLEKKTYKVPLQKGYRCVVLIDGFFEWKTDKGGKQPYFFHVPQPSGISFSKKFKYETDKCEPLKHESSDDIKSENVTADSVDKTEVQDKCEPLKHESSPDIETENVTADSSEVQDDLCNVKGQPKIEEFNDKKEIKPKTESFCDNINKSKPENNDNSSNEINDSLETGAIQSMVDGESRKRKFNSGDKFDEENDGVEEWTGQRLLTVAGVYDIWKSSSNSSPLYSYSVITVPSSSSFSWCHHRMPAILSSDEEIADWLDYSRVSLKEASALIRPTDGLSFYPVTKNMNNSRYKNADCVEPIDISKPKPSPSSNFMMNWLKAPEKKKN